MDKVKIQIVPPKLAIKAMMDSGYRNAAYALAELMDNSIQADAKNVELLCIEKTIRSDRRNRARIDSIGVLDNGCGMSQETLRLALQFGYGERLAAKDHTGMGKFGMGLPSASISQARKVEVWSWVNGIESAKYSYLDVDDIIAGRMTVIEEPINKPVPEIWVTAGQNFSKSGTLVVWTGLERCIWRTGKAIIDNSEFLIGRMYRKFLNNDSTKIRMATFDGDTDSSTPTFEKYAKPNDPLYLMRGTSTPPPYDIEPMFEPWPSADNYETEILIPYAGHTHSVFIRTSMAKKESRASEVGDAGRRSYGAHAEKNIGVSLLRAGRELELDRSWAAFGEPRERWWGLEVEFPPSLDDLFGVTNNKQYATNFTEMSKIDVDDWLKEQGKTFQQLKDELFEDQDPKLPLIELTQAIRKNIREMSNLVKVQLKNSRGGKRRTRYGFGPEEEATAKTRLLQGEGHSGVSDAGELKPNDERCAEIQAALEESGLAEKEANEFAGSVVSKSMKYIFTEAGIDTPSFFSVQPKGGAILLTLNTNHPAYDRLVDVLEKDSSDNDDNDSLQERLNNALDGLKLLLMAWARYEDEQQSGVARERAQEARVDWGRMARRFLDRGD